MARQNAYATPTRHPSQKRRIRRSLCLLPDPRSGGSGRAAARASTAAAAATATGLPGCLAIRPPSGRMFPCRAVLSAAHTPRKGVGLPGLFLTTQHHWGGGVQPSVDPPPPPRKKIGSNFFPGLRPIKCFLWCLRRQSVWTRNPAPLGAGGAHAHGNAARHVVDDLDAEVSKTVKQPPEQPEQPPVRRLLGSANAETAPQGTPVVPAVRMQRPDAARGGTNG